MKRCSRCGDVKETGEFNRHAAQPDGLQVWCRACHREYREDNRRRLLAQQREHYGERRPERAEYARRNNAHRSALRAARDAARRAARVG